MYVTIELFKHSKTNNPSKVPRLTNLLSLRSFYAICYVAMATELSLKKKINITKNLQSEISWYLNLTINYPEQQQLALHQRVKQMKKTQSEQKKIT